MITQALTIITLLGSGALFSITIVLLYYLLFFVVPILLFGAFFAKTSKEAVKEIALLANMKQGETAADLGSGDGRLTIALAEKGAQVHGYEINPFLVLLSKYFIRKSNLDSKVFVHWKNFWHENFSDFDVVVLYGIGYIMNRLEKKLQAELKPGARIISNGFKFPNWQYTQKVDNIYLYVK